MIKKTPVQMENKNKKEKKKTKEKVRKRIKKDRNTAAAAIIIIIIIIIIIAAAAGYERIGTGMRGLGNKSWGYTNYSILEVGQNTKKSPGDLRRVAVTPEENYQLTLGWKTLKLATLIIWRWYQ